MKYGYIFKGVLYLQVVGFLSAVLLCVDFYVLFQNITFNKPRSENQSNEKP